MGQINAIYNVLHDTGDEEVHFKTNAGQVKTKKADGSEGTAQESLNAIREAFSLSGTTLTIDLDKLGGV